MLAQSALDKISKNLSAIQWPKTHVIGGVGTYSSVKVFGKIHPDPERMKTEMNIWKKIYHRGHFPNVLAYIGTVENVIVSEYNTGQILKEKLSKMQIPAKLEVIWQLFVGYSELFLTHGVICRNISMHNIAVKTLQCVNKFTINEKEILSRVFCQIFNFETFVEGDEKLFMIEFCLFFIDMFYGHDDILESFCNFAQIPSLYKVINMTDLRHREQTKNYLQEMEISFLTEDNFYSWLLSTRQMPTYSANKVQNMEMIDPLMMVPLKIKAEEPCCRISRQTHKKESKTIPIKKTGFALLECENI